MAREVTERHAASPRVGGVGSLDEGDLRPSALSSVSVSEFARGIGRASRTVYRWIQFGVELPYPAVRLDVADGRRAMVLVDPDGWQEITR